MRRSCAVALLSIAACRIADVSFTDTCSQGFPSAPAMATGALPWAIAAVDVSGDRKLDLVVVDSGANTVSVLLGNGDGTFQPRTDYATGMTPYAVAVADVTGDGHPDLVVANSGDDTVSVLLGDGAGGFVPSTAHPIGFHRPSSVALADVSGDRVLDLVVANSDGDGTVDVRPGNGDGTFAATGNLYKSGMGTFALAVVDVTGDGVLDLVVSNVNNSTGDSLSVLAGSSDGMFATRVPYSTGGFPYQIAVADATGDGVLDLVAANYGDNTVSVLAGDGRGMFQPRIDLATGVQPSSVAVADVSGDGVPDLVVVNSGGGTASVLVGNGDSTFQARADYDIASGPYRVAVADVNDDGRADLVVANYGANSVSVLLATCRP